MIKIYPTVKYYRLRSKVEDQEDHQLKNLLLKAKNKKRLINNSNLLKIRLIVLARFSKQRKVKNKLKIKISASL